MSAFALQEEVEDIIYRMGYVIVVSVPVILFIMIVAITCYLVGRNQGRRQAAATVSQYGPPAPPPPFQPPPPRDEKP